MFPKFHFLKLCASVAVLTLLPTQEIFAQTVPSSADPSRLRPAERLPPSRADKVPQISNENAFRAAPAPYGAEEVTFTLQAVDFQGMTAFKRADLADLYENMLGKQVSLQQIYDLAAAVTRRYRESGYMLSYTYVPDQEIENGAIRLKVVEGFIGSVSIEGKDPDIALTNQYASLISAQKPLRDKSLESILLRLNDLPGRYYRAILNRLPGAPDEEFSLVLVPIDKPRRASISFDNFGSRYLGPNEVSAVYADSFLPSQQTTLFALKSLPLDKLGYLSLGHSYAFAPGWTVDGTLSYTKAHPGYTLEPLEISSKTTGFTAGINYQWLRQRQENLLLKLSFEARNVSSDFFANTPLTRDNVRSIHAAISYDRGDDWGGSNILNAILTQGVSGLGASSAGEPFLSRSEAKPDFTKLELSLSRLQTINRNWDVLMQAAGQISSGPLFASEEFGVGGQIYGRAYDSSEIVGDEGMSGMVELRYTGLRTMQPVNFEPFVYYDVGFVSNSDAGQAPRDSLASAGGGVRFATIWNQSGSLGLSFPLTRPVNAPIYGQAENAPRIMLQFGQSF